MISHIYLKKIILLTGNHDVLISMPDGIDRSLCYQLPGAMQENKITIVFCPLQWIPSKLQYLRKHKIRVRSPGINGKKMLYWGCGERSRLTITLNCRPEKIVKWSQQYDTSYEISLRNYTRGSYWIFPECHQIIASIRQIGILCCRGG